MDNIDLHSPPEGAFPYRFTHDDRFQYRVKVQPVAGHLEFSIRAVDTRLAAMADRRRFEGFPRRGVVCSSSSDPADSLRRSKLRAKSMVRLLALEMGIDRMFTFTIRHTGQAVPYDTVLKAWDLFRRSMEKHYPGFRYLATPELQKNGQWHIHAGTRGFMNVNIIRSLWVLALNRVLGRSKLLTSGPDSPGNVNVTFKQHLKGDPLRRASKIAAYIAKYIGKAMEVAFNRKRYFHSHGVKVPPALSSWLKAQDCDEAIIEVMTRHGLIGGAGIAYEDLAFSIWRRDSCSAWFRINADALAPPF